jgi:protein-S-isoprenylcysteine O-methyltransferase Ste14
MVSDDAADSATSSARKSTGSLKSGTGSLRPGASDTGDHAGGLLASFRPPLARNLEIRLAELAIFLVAVVGAVALGLGISDYFQHHPYVGVYLLAYAAFRLADLFVREDAALGTDRARIARRMISYLPLLALFAAAPFERTYIYGGNAPNWLAGLGILIELAGLWLALGARVQLAFFSSAADSERPKLVRNGLYRYIRHPVFAGEFLTIFAWPFEYGAPITFLLTLVAGLLVMRRRIMDDEADMLAQFGDEYAAYMRETDSVIPNVW